jgi:hypothetical protein
VTASERDADADADGSSGAHATRHANSDRDRPGVPMGGSLSCAWPPLLPGAWRAEEESAHGVMDFCLVGKKHSRTDMSCHVE